MNHLAILKMISDGNLYKADDMVPADSYGCKECSFCCENMCDTIVIDPYDLYSMTKGFGKDFIHLLEEGYLEMGLHDLLMLPHIKNTGSGCGFLTDEKRCGIYSIRPGICRLFPLGRFYHDGTFSYIIQTHECKVEERGLVKVKDWLNIEELEKYEEYANTWHYFIKKLSNFIMESKDYETKDHIKESLLDHFYRPAYDTDSDFYAQFKSRMENWEQLS